MILERYTVSPRDVLEGNEDVTLESGEVLKIETSPSGKEVLDVECPVGKRWKINIHVSIVETDL